MVPEIQLMIRVERGAGQKRRPTSEDRGDYSLFELIHPGMHVKRIRPSRR